MLSDDGRVAITYNGEVYNYKELRRELSAKHTFVTESDTEVLLRAYEEWGIECLERLRGMFAFAVHDKSERRLFLARDRVGIKPLYYYLKGTSFAFASELTALLQLSWVEREIDEGSIAAFFRHMYVPTPETIYRDVKKLEPGCFLEVDLERRTVDRQRYWKLRVGAVEAGECEWSEMLDAELDEVMRMYVRSDAPYGSFLSGGVDSSLVSAVAARHAPPPLRTFSIGFQEREVSELPYAAEASRTIPTDHHERIVTPELTSELLVRMVRHFGEPFADSSSVPTFYVSQVAAEFVKMVLSGDGGDELFGGYVSYSRTYTDYRSRLTPARRTLFRWLSHCGPHPRVRRRAAFLALNHREKYLHQREIFDDEALGQLLGADTSLPERRKPEMADGTATDPVMLCQLEDFKTYLLDDILVKVDRMSMANSLEVRVPLLDHRIVELAFSLPLDLKIRSNGLLGTTTKYVLKRSARRFFTESFLERPKQGFGIPVVKWCRGPLQPAIEESLLNARSPVYEFLNYPWVAHTVRNFFGGQTSACGMVWCLFMFALWMRNVHERP